MTATTAAAPPRRAAKQREAASGSNSVQHGGNRAGWAMSAPFLVMYVLFLLGPVVYGLLMSLFNTSTVSGGPGDFVGLSNYREAFSSSDFWKSMWHTVLFTLISSPILVVLALSFAVMAERIPRAKWFYRLVFFAPFAVPVSSVVLIFNWMYAPQIGLLPKIFTGLGFTEPNFLGTPNWAMASVVLLTIWWTVGFNFVLYLAGLQDIPTERYEAAAVDGATPWQQIKSITMPLLSRTTTLVIVLQLLASLRVFDQIYLLLSGGPNYSTRPVLEYIYDVGFTDYRAGYAAAATTVYFVLLVLVSAGWFALNRRRAAGEA